MNRSEDRSIVSLASENAENWYRISEQYHDLRDPDLDQFQTGSKADLTPALVTAPVFALSRPSPAPGGARSLRSYWSLQILTTQMIRTAGRQRIS